MAIDKDDINKITEAIRAGQTGSIGAGNSAGVVSGGADAGVNALKIPFQKLGEVVGNNTEIFEIKQYWQ